VVGVAQYTRRRRTLRGRGRVVRDVMVTRVLGHATLPATGR